ncbi:MAG: S1C family serine protease [Candidatus Dormibacteria bacterium]
MALAEELTEAAAQVRELGMPHLVGVGGRWPSGSGFVFADGLVATSAHNVFGDGAGTHVHFADGTHQESRGARLDRAGDLALLEVDSGGRGGLAWAEGPAALGAPVFAAANPGGRGARLSVGVVAALDGDFRGPRGHLISGGFEHTAPLPHGASGGPVFDFSGRLLGLNTKRLGEGFYAALSADSQLHERLLALGRGEQVVRAYLGVGLLPGEAARRLRAAVGLPGRSGVLVRHVDEEGPAAKAGVTRGDLLTSLGDVPLARIADLQRALRATRPGQELSLALVRGADELNLQVTLAQEPEGDPSPRFGPHRHHRQGHPHQD